MDTDLLRGKTLRWRYEDGPVKGKTFEHAFALDGTVTYREAGGTASEIPVRYEVLPITSDVYAVSYLASNGFTLTTIIDTKSRRIVSFASNEKMLVTQRGELLD